jgi:glucose-6-phosphate dehydrogenase assembly protein OpcA
MPIVDEVERELFRLRARESDGSLTGLRTSTMTHVVWAPLRWLERAREVLAGLEERHPARTIFLIPERGRSNQVKADVHLRQTTVEGLPGEVFAEVIELRLRGGASEHPASLLLPLLVSDLPAFCRWRGEPDWRSSALAEIVGVCDRLVVNSSEWMRPSRGYARLVSLFDRIAVSDIAFSRTLPWRARISELWPSVAEVERVRVEGPQADALLLAGWLRSRLRRDVALSRRGAPEVNGVWLDGEPVEAIPGAPRSPSDLLSDELDVAGRDRVYEAAVRAAADASELDDAWL